MPLFTAPKKAERLLVGKLWASGLEILKHFKPGEPFSVSKYFLYHPYPHLLEAAFSFFSVAD